MYLTYAGYGTGGVDGILGAKTIDAILSLRRRWDCRGPVPRMIRFWLPWPEGVVDRGPSSSELAHWSIRAALSAAVNADHFATSVT